jgi:GWxTD domain-containing protein
VLENIRQIAGMDFLAQAARSFARALEADPTFASGLVDLAEVAMRQRVRPRLAVAQEALRSAAATPAGRAPEVQLARGRIERLLGAHDSALAAFRGALAAGGDSTIGWLELARTQAVIGRRDSTAAAYAAATRRPVSAAGRQELLRDLRSLLEPEEAAAFAALPSESLGVWLRRFWDGRGATDGRLGTERLTEHLRRLQYARENFRLVSRRRHYDVAFAYRDTTQTEFDDRGVVYIRHGEPTERRQFAGFDANETWLYRRTPPQPDLVLNFVAIGDVQDYRLVESLRQVCTRRYSADPLQRAQAELDLQAAQCLHSRSGLTELYDRLIQSGASQPNLWAQERQQGIAQVREAIATDSYVMPFVAPLEPVVSWFTVADGSLRPELHVVFAVPAQRLHPERTGEAAAYILALRVIVVDATRQVVASLDTVRVFRSAQPLGAGLYLTEQVALRVPPGDLRFTFVVEEPHAEAGSAATAQPLDVPVFAAGVAVSDLVLGREGSGLVWRRPEGEVLLNPLARYPRDGAATLYYELYGLPQAAAVPTRVRVAGRGRSVIRRLFGGGGGSRADLSYTTVTDAPGLARVRQRLDLRDLEPGRYTLELSITDPVSGRAIVRRAPFEIEAQRAP